MRSGELPSYRDGGRKILMKSIRDRLDRLFAADTQWHPLVAKPPRSPRNSPRSADRAEA
jgi:hypothetical protein